MDLAYTHLYGRALPTVDTLFPLTQGLSSWSTFPSAPNALPLDSTTLNPQNNIGELGPFYEVGPNDKPSIRIHYTEGSYKLSARPRGGISFYSAGPEQAKITGDAKLTNAREATFGYSVYFPDDFDFVMGGKLPGFFGGNDFGGSTSCSGGRKDTTCFSTCLMWRTAGAGELYGYFPPSSEPGFETNADLCNGVNNICDPSYGISLGRGNFTFPRGQWTTVSQRVRLNDPGVPNGEVELWADGKSVIKSQNILIRDASGSGRIQGISVQSFFGGNSTEWATPRDQDIWIADFSVAVIEDLDTPPKNETTKGTKDDDSAAGGRYSHVKALVWGSVLLSVVSFMGSI